MSSWRFPRRLGRSSVTRPHLPDTIVGVVKNIDDLVAVINDTSRPVSDRVTAAGMVRSSIETRSVSSIQEIWYSTVTLLDLDNQPEVRRAGWRLMISCIVHDDINNGAFSIYYHTLVSQSNVEDFDLVLEALKFLTSSGKRVLGGAQLSPCRLPIVLVRWMQLLAVRSQELRSNSLARDVLEPWGSSTEGCFHALLEYISATLKFSMGLYEPTDLENLLLCAVAIVRNTSSVRDVELSCSVVDTVMAFGILPVVVLQPVLEVLCGVYYMVSALSSESWGIIRRLCYSHLRSSTIVRLCRILMTSNESEITISMRVGACIALQKIVLEFERDVPSPSQSSAAASQVSLIPPTADTKSGSAATSTTTASTSTANVGGSSQTNSGNTMAAQGNADSDDSDDFDVPILEVLTAYSAALTTQPPLKLSVAIATSLFELLKESKSLTELRPALWIWQDEKASPLHLLSVLGELCSVQAKPSDPAQPSSNGPTPSYWAHGGSMVGVMERTATPVSLSSISDTSAEPKKDLSLSDIVSNCLGILTRLLHSKTAIVPTEETCRLCLKEARLLSLDAIMLLLQTLESIQFCSPYMPGWTDRAELAFTQLYLPPSTPAPVRSAVLNLVADMYKLNPEEAEGASSLSAAAFSVIGSAEPETVDVLISVYKELYARSEINWDPFEQISEQILNMLFPNKQQPAYAKAGSNNSAPSTASNASKVKVATAIASLFAKALPVFFKQAQFLYRSLIFICQQSLDNTETFSAAFAPLCRLRADFQGRLSFTQPLIESAYGADIVSQQSVSPELVDKIIDQPSLVLRTVDDEDYDGKNDALISTTPILELYRDALGSSSEGVATLAMMNFPSQLSNIRLFMGPDHAIVLGELRNILLSLVTTRKLPFVCQSQPRKVAFTSMAVHGLTILLPREDVFPRQEQDRLVQQLTLSLNHWDQSSHWVIHGLVTCCYEFPQSIQRFLPQLLSKFQTKITNKESSMYILEFLLSISLIESLTDNFNIQEFKRVFGMCFMYIQNANDLLLATKQTQSLQTHEGYQEKHPNASGTPPASAAASGAAAAAPSTQEKPSQPHSTGAQSHQQQTQSSGPGEQLNEIVAQYQLRLAYTTICYLYLAINLPSRRSLAPYLVRNLILADNDAHSLDPMSLAVYDLISRYTYSNLALSLHSRASVVGGINIKDEAYDVRRWLNGAVVVEIAVHKQTGEGLLVLRRPTGTILTEIKPTMRPVQSIENQALANHLKIAEDESANQGVPGSRYESPLIDVAAVPGAAPAEEEPVLYSANFALIESQSLRINDLTERALLPTPIPVDAQTDRAVATLDRTPVVDFHKVGIVYLAPRQNSEADALGNRSGSPAYRRFLSSIGSLLRLKANREFYVGGLDTENDLDGEYAYGWRSKISQMIFHATTLMPNREGDTAFSAKKRHIGNNFVNIYFDESGVEFDFNIVKSQFNFINIVLTPTYMPDKWRVRAYRQPGLANALTAYEMKVVSERNLALFVRNLALKASQYAAVHNMGGEYTDNWVHRIKLIEQLRDRLAQRGPEADENGDNGDDNGDGIENGEDIALATALDFTKYTI